MLGILTTLKIMADLACIVLVILELMGIHAIAVAGTVVIIVWVILTVCLGLKWWEWL